MPSTRPMSRSNSSDRKKSKKPPIIDGNPKKPDTFFEPYTPSNYKEGHKSLTPDNKVRRKHRTMIDPQKLNTEITAYGDQGDKYKPVEVTGRHPYIHAFKPNKPVFKKLNPNIVNKIHELYPEYTLPVKPSSRGAPPGASLSRRNPLTKKRSNKRSKEGGRKTRKAQQK